MLMSVCTEMSPWIFLHLIAYMYMRVRKVVYVREAQCEGVMYVYIFVFVNNCIMYACVHYLCILYICISVPYT